MKIIQELKTKIKDAFEKAGYKIDVEIKFSDRPELSDFQCNDALKLAKKEKKNPREIADKIVENLLSDDIFKKVSVDGPGFINIKMKNSFWIEQAKNMLGDSRLGISKAQNPQTVVVDYGGPNVAKPLHAGHLRASVIGESVKRIVRFAGNKTIGDAHFGDWGLQMGLVFAEIERRDIAPVYFDKNYNGEYPKSSPVNMTELADIYPSASKRSKKDEDFKKKAQDYTVRLQTKDKGFMELWTHCHDVSLDSIKKSYSLLGINFDLWMGEADVHDRTMELIEIFKKEKKIFESDGALVIHVKEPSDKKEMPPVLVLKSNGSVGYHTTDIATVEFRKKNLEATKIIYVTDNRQKLHFEQLFRAVKKVGIVDEDFPLFHVAHGTMNGKDGTPFKTRDGGVISLEDMIDLVKQAGLSRLNLEKFEGDLSDEEKEKIATQIGVASLKFGDLINLPKSDYILDLDAFSKFEGKTGPYIQYTAVRINSILQKTDEKGKFGEISHEEEKKLLQKLLLFQLAFEKSVAKLSPHYLCVSAFEIAQSFNAFYHACPILNLENKKIRQHRLAICNLTYKTLNLFADLIGIQIPDRM
ncbi:MAG: arginine--tRNA ligase [Alphaproteobacteria bacterium]